MTNMTIPRTNYEGVILSNITTFGIVQDLLDNPKEAKMFHLVDLESIIESLLFHERILVIDLTSLGAYADVEMPNIMTELTEKNLLEKYSPEFRTTNIEELSNLLKEAPELRDSRLVRKIYSSGFGDHYQELASIYDRLFGISGHKMFPEFQKLLRQMGVIDKNAIPIYIQLMQTKVYMKCLESLDKQVGGQVPYKPHVGRVSLTRWMSKFYKRRALPVAREIIMKLELSERQRREALNQSHEILELELKLPILTSMILSECNKPSDILDEILNMRKSGNVRRFRNYCNRFQQVLFNGDQRAMEKYDLELETMLSEIYKKEEIAMQQIESIPRYVYDLAKKNEAAILLKFVNKGISALLKYLGKRDLLFLGDVRNRMYNIRHSVDEFERVFNVKPKL